MEISTQMGLKEGKKFNNVKEFNSNKEKTKHLNSKTYVRENTMNLVFTKREVRGRSSPLLKRKKPILQT